jgi:hypothetical protein
MVWLSKIFGMPYNLEWMEYMIWTSYIYTLGQKKYQLQRPSFLGMTVDALCIGRLGQPALSLGC